MIDARQPCRRGFTLIEIMIALAIVVAMVALATPMVRRGGPESRLLEDAERIRLVVARAREKSAREGAMWQVRVTHDQRGGWRGIAEPVAESQPESTTETPESGEVEAWALILPDGSAVELQPLEISIEGTRPLRLRISELTAATTTEWVEPEKERQP